GSAARIAGRGGAGALAVHPARVAAGAALGVVGVGGARPPIPRIDAIGLFHPAAGAAWTTGAPSLGERPLIVHDAKPLLEAWLPSQPSLPVVEDTALAAYLLNPARATYKLDEVCMEALGECPPTLPAVAPTGLVVDDGLGAVLGERARWTVRFWKYAAGELEERALR